MASSFSDLPSRLPLQLRKATISENKINQEKRTVEFTFSSTTPIMRQFGLETLSHNPEAADLSRLEDAGPVLDSHDWARQIGVVERAWLRGGKGHALARFSDNPHASEVFNDIVKGIKRNISVGYEIRSMERTKRGTGREPDEYTVNAWTAWELSVVSVAADVSIGIGRSGEIFQ
jgi:hypothetical protein